MSSPGFTGAGASEFFGSAGRSTTMNNPSAAAATSATNNNHLLRPSHHPLYRTQQQLPALFLDPSSQIAPRQTPTTTFIGKRTLAEFQTQQQQNHLLNHNNLSHNNLNHNHHVLSSLLLRSVKPRTATFHNSSSMPPLDFSIPELQSPSSHGFQTQRFGMPLLHQLRPNPINLPNHNANNNNNNNMGLPITNSVLQNPNFPYRTSNLGQAQNQVQPPDPDKKIMDHRLQELEKQLLEDEEEGEADAASVITTSEWSETIQNLMANGSTQKPASSSPTSSTTSSTSSSSSVASSATGCWKHTLMEAASAISEGKNDVATEILTRLGQVYNPNGNWDQRLKDCMVAALKSKINPFANHPPVAELFSTEHAESTHILFENSLCFKVGFIAANLAILESALEEKTKEEKNNSNRFCIVDFDIGQGKQYMILLQELSARGRTPPAKFRIVAVAESGGEERLRAVGDMLQLQAEKFRIGFEFKVVVVTQRLAELTRESLGCDMDEPLAVNFAFKLNRIPDESVSTENPRDELLRRVKSLSPRVVTVVEQEMNANTAPFLARVAESCSYYGALFDSVESALGMGSPERVKVEEGLSQKLCNSVACEGRDRVERCEVFGKWRARMGMAGFQLKPVKGVAESIKSRLAALGGSNNRVNSALTVKEDNGGICFGWMGKTLTVASAWR